VLAALFGCITALPLAGCASDKQEATSTHDVSTHRPEGSDAGGAEPQPTMLPTAKETCPQLATGNATILGQTVQLWVGERQEDRKAPVLFYWHGTGSVSAEAGVFMQKQIDEIVADGGLVASFVTSTGTGDYTGPFVWHSDDFNVADEILACAIQQLNVETRRIYSAGCSAGGLQTSAMVYMRSGYIAAAMPNSGGTGNPLPLQDPSHVPAVITTHGAPGSDVVVIDFSVTSAAFVNDLTAKGGFAVDCNHGGGHCGATPEVVAAQWQFLKDHPFGVTPEPYASGLPASFPASCKIGLQ
jgi:hypothetical protein